MKKLMYIALTLALALGAGACSTDQTPATTPSTDTPAASAAPADSNVAVAPAPAPAPSAAPARSRAAAPAPAPAPARPAAPLTYAVPEGTELTVVLIDPISSGTNKAGDQFTASLAEPIVVGGQTIAAKGALVNGRIVDAEGSGRVSGKATMRLVLTSIADGAKTYPIVTKPFVAEADGSTKRDAGIIGGAAGIGAAIGAIAGGKGGAAKGAVIGGAAGTGTVLATKGKEVEFGSESRLKFMLEKSASLPKIVS